ncbi:hypothetical protein E2320_014026, partial [Naja naja]
TRSNPSRGLEDTGAVQKFTVESGEKTSCYNGRTWFCSETCMALLVLCELTRVFRKASIMGVLKTRSNPSRGLEDTGAVQKFTVESGEKTSCYNGRTWFLF